MEDVGTLFGHLVYFTALWYILLPFGTYILSPFGICYGYLVYFGMLYHEKSGNPCSLPLLTFLEFFSIEQHAQKFSMTSGPEVNFACMTAFHSCFK
jgi:hypothetical protein